ncbi:MAG: HAMP domain-containing sensor histidine kinase [Bacteroidetes bacterium]|nr:HAMP domain-containing sensor histidine kinase [Bacteroidota bacterium]
MTLLCAMILPVSAIAQLNFSETHYEVDGMIPESQCVRITRDQRGAYWILTYEGRLLRWDGNSFAFGGGNYRPGNSKNIPLLLNVNLSAAGTPFFTPADGSQPFFFIDSSSQVQRYTNSDSASSTYSHEGNFVILKRSWKEIFALNDQAMAAAFKRAFLYDKNFSFHGVITEEAFYLVSRSVVYYYNKGKLTRFFFPGNPESKAAWIVGEHLLLSNSDAYLLYQDGVQVGSGRNALLKDFVTAGTKYCNSRHSLILNFRNNFYRLTVKKQKLLAEKYLTLPSSRSLFNAIYADEESRRLIVAESSGGFSVFEESLVKYINRFDDPQKNIITTITLVKNGFYTNQDFQDIVKDSVSVLRYFNPFVVTPGGDVFYPTRFGFFLFNQQKIIQKRWDINPSIPVTTIATVGEHIYVAASSLWRYNMADKELRPVICIPPIQPKETVWAVTTGPGESLFLICDAFLYQMNRFTGQRTLLSADSIPQGPVRCMFYDTAYNSVFFVVKNQGLFIADLSSGKIRKLPYEQFPELYTAFYVLKDKEGDFWIITNNDLYLMYKGQLQDFLQYRSRYINYYRFGKRYGFGKDEYNGGVANAGIPVGDSFYLSSMHGIVSFDPLQVKKITSGISRTSIHVYELRVDDSVYYAADRLVLPPDYKFCSVKLDFPYISMPGALLEYQLKGIKDTSWLPVGNQSEILLRNLSPGKYTLRIRVHDQPLVAILEIPINAREVWYKTTGVYLLLFAFLSGVLLLLFHWRIQRVRNKSLREIDRNRRELFTIISHDLRSPLKAYQGLADTVSDLLRRKQYDRVARVASLIDSVGIKLDMLLSNLLNWNLLQQEKIRAKSHPLDLAELAEELIDIYAEIASLKGTSIVFYRNTPGMVLADKDMVSLMIRNLLDNAIKNSVPNSDITVELRDQDDKIAFVIRNNFDIRFADKILHIRKLFSQHKSWQPGENGMGMGLRMVQLAAQKMNAVVDINLNENSVIFHIFFKRRTR